MDVYINRVRGGGSRVPSSSNSLVLERIVVDDWRGTWILLLVYVSTSEDEVVKERIVCFSSWNISGREVYNDDALSEVVILLMNCVLASWGVEEYNAISNRVRFFVATGYELGEEIPVLLSSSNSSGLGHCNVSERRGLEYNSLSIRSSIVFIFDFFV